MDGDGIEADLNDFSDMVAMPDTLNDEASVVVVS
jgi:hypothetical protein